MFARQLAVLVAATVVIGLHAKATRAETVNRWVQMAPGNTVLLRAITDGPNDPCPVASVDGTPVTLARRGDSTGANGAFPITMCEASVARGGTTATIDGVALKMPVADPRRIVVIGDTGCRVAQGLQQNCNDPGPTGFPLAQLATFVATFNPDLIVHVGDYYYREMPCAAGNAGCAGTPYGDAWPAWNADWFTPARAIMAAAPLAMSRGNHESCGRGSQGWFSLLDPHPYDPSAVACRFGSAYDYPPSYVVDAGPVSLIMFDSSFSNTGLANPTTDSSFTKVESVAASHYAPDLAAQLASLHGKPAFFVTHRPAYGFVDIKRRGDTSTFIGGTPDEEAMFSGGVPEPIRLLLSGHIHQFEAVEMQGEQYAPQLIVGMSGTFLDRRASDTVMTPGGVLAAATGTDLPVESMMDVAGEFGFAVLDRTEGGYQADLYWMDGVPHGHCVLQIVGERRITCTQ
jgi:hypothetical protein